MASIDDLVKKLNNITREIVSGKAQRNSRADRKMLMKRIINHMDFDPKKRYVLVRCIRPEIFISYSA